MQLQERDHLLVTPVPRIGGATMHAIAMEVAEKHHLTHDELFGRQRSRRLAWARQEAMYRMSKETTNSLPQIGRFFDRDHTTVLHGIRAHEKRLAERGEG